MSRLAWGIVLVVAGVIVALLSVLADQLGIGAGDDLVGWKQSLGMVIGLLIAGAGAVLIAREA